MKPTKQNSRIVLVATLAALAAPAAWSQVGGAVNSTVNAGAGAAQRVVTPPTPLPAVNPPPAPPAAAVNSGVQAGASAQSAANAASRPAAGAVSGATGVQAATNVHGERPLRSGAEVGAGADVSAAARTNSVATQAQTSLHGSLNTAETAQQLRATAMEHRDSVLNAVESRIDAGADASARLQRSAKRIEGSARTEYDASVKELRAREKALQSSLRAARKAGADNWEQARTQLAADYEAYSQAMTQLETSAGSLEAQGAARGNANRR
jgi:hypothetical protein